MCEYSTQLEYRVTALYMKSRNPHSYESWVVGYIPTYTSSGTYS